MERAYQSGIKNDVTFFVGDEIEHTPAFNKRTLIVVGLDEVEKISTLAKKYNCTHIYIGANQSFKFDIETIEKWDLMVIGLLKLDYWVTWDFDIRDYENITDSMVWTCEYDRFIPQISVKIPYISNLNYNATVKIDDRDFRSTNPGVWVHTLHDLMDRKKFTDWSEYSNDTTIG